MRKVYQCYRTLARGMIWMPGEMVEISMLRNNLFSLVSSRLPNGTVEVLLPIVSFQAGIK